MSVAEFSMYSEYVCMYVCMYVCTRSHDQKKLYIWTVVSACLSRVCERAVKIIIINILLDFSSHHKFLCLITRLNERYSDISYRVHVYSLPLMHQSERQETSTKWAALKALRPLRPSHIQLQGCQQRKHHSA